MIPFNYDNEDKIIMMKKDNEELFSATLNSIMFQYAPHMIKDIPFHKDTVIGIQYDKKTNDILFFTEEDPK